jgi:predicted nucleic acid-binding protein
LIFVDTSVWIAAFRKAESREARHLNELLDLDEVALAVAVRLEILAGTSRQNLTRMRRNLAALPTFFPTQATWRMMEGWVERASSAGQRFGFSDLLIGALAEEQRAAIWSLDSDFERLANLGLIDLYSPPA